LSEEILYQMMDKLSSIETRIDGIDRRIDNMESNMATKDDIANMATKDDIANMATKDDIANMATKDDIANMATKDDIAELHSKFDMMSSDLRRMETKLDATFEQVAHLTEFETTVKQLAVTVEENTTDIKLLKKLVSIF
jgi:hypothetical protein